MSSPAWNQDHLRYYFDELQRDALDRGPSYRRSAEILSIREQLLHLPDTAFAQAVSNIRNLLTNGTPNQRPGTREEQAMRREAFNEIFRNVGPARNAASPGTATAIAQKI